MAGLAILRVVKLKTFGNIGGSEAHTARLQETLNADPQKMNLRLIGDDYLPLEEIVQFKIKFSTKYKPRKNAVLCSEMFLSASPEYFRPHDPSRAGEWDLQLMKKFASTSKIWLMENYGDKCVRAELHLDEATPHIHAYIVPVNDKTKQLSHNEMFGGSAKECRIKLSKLQDSYAAALAPLGIERGVKGSKATHTKIKEYYHAVNSQPLSLELARLAPQPGETAQQLYERIQADPVIQQLDHQLADRHRAIEHERWAHQSAIASEKLRQQLEAENAMLRQQQEQLRDLALEDVAWHLGLDCDHQHPGIWNAHGYIINIHNDQWNNFAPIQKQGGDTSIDLVMHVNRCNYRQAIAWLHDSFGATGVDRAVIAQARQVAAEFAQLEPRPKFIPPAADERQWQVVHNYLTQDCGILPNFVQAVHEQGLIYADEQQNAVFLIRDLDGETKGAFSIFVRGKGQGYVIPSKRTEGWFHFKVGQSPKGEIQKVVLCKSPIEVLSLASLSIIENQGNPERTMYMAVDSHKSLPVDFLSTVSHIEVAHPNDEFDNETVRIIMEQLHHAQRVKPKGKDWNDTLCTWKKNQKQKGPELEL
ncbi:MobV family relaxase [Nostoc sp. CCY0012]|uniref:MobV family relaxase n=1 Tax=Nostoc sp. CCY0012 TaxID=1056123 RepID=UPI0039C5E8C6